MLSHIAEIFFSILLVLGIFAWAFQIGAHIAATLWGGRRLLPLVINIVVYISFIAIMIGMTTYKAP